MSVPCRGSDGSPSVPDVDAIMQRVRARVAERLASGVDTPEDLDEVRRIESGVRERADFGPALADDIALVHTALDPLGPHAFTSHRGGVAGGLIVAAKRWLRRLVRPVAAVALVRQAAFNGAVARLLTVASRGVQSLEADNDALLRRLDELERLNRELTSRCDTLQADVRGLQARVDREGME